MHIVVVFIAAVIPILFAAIDGARGVDPVLVDSALTLGCRGFRTATAVVLPAALPHIVTGAHPASLGVVAGGLRWRVDCSYA
jgi:NitT/TauT family transport system permease protein